jgi:uncharacterized membrane protein YesL
MNRYLVLLIQSFVTFSKHYNVKLNFVQSSGLGIGYSIPGHILMNMYCIINLAHTFFVECLAHTFLVLSCVIEYFSYTTYVVIEE